MLTRDCNALDIFRRELNVIHYSKRDLRHSALSKLLLHLLRRETLEHVADFVDRRSEEARKRLERRVVWCVRVRAVCAGQPTYLINKWDDCHALGGDKLLRALEALGGLLAALHADFVLEKRQVVLLLRVIVRAQVRHDLCERRVEVRRRGL
jgi:hypothetical protein